MVTSEPSGSMAWMPLNNHGVGQADLRHPLDGQLRPGGRRRGQPRVHRPRPPRLDGRQRAGRELPDGRLAHVQLALGRADRLLPGREQRRPLRRVRAHGHRRRRPLLRVPGAEHHAARKATNKAIMDHAGGHHPLPGAVQRAVPVQRQRHRRRAAERRLRGGDADQDRLRRRLHRQQRADLQPREHAPVVGRQRVLRRQPSTRSSRRATRTSRSTTSWPTTPARRRRPGGLGRVQGGVRGVDRDPLQRTSYNTTSTTFWSVAPANPTSANLFGTANTYNAPGHVLHRAARDPRQGQLPQGQQGDPARLRRRLDLAAAARSRSSRSTCRTSRSAA